MLRKEKPLRVPRILLGGKWFSQAHAQVRQYRAIFARLWACLFENYLRVFCETFLRTLLCMRISRTPLNFRKFPVSVKCPGSFRRAQKFPARSKISGSKRKAKFVTLRSKSARPDGTAATHERHRCDTWTTPLRHMNDTGATYDINYTVTTLVWTTQQRQWQEDDQPWCDTWTHQCGMWTVHPRHWCDTWTTSITIYIELKTG